MADNNLDALVYAYDTIPPPVVYPNRIADGYNARTEPACPQAPERAWSDLDLLARRNAAESRS